MRPSARQIGLCLVACFWAGAASAQVRTACFDGQSLPAPGLYALVTEVASAVSEAPRFRTSVIIRPGSRGDLVAEGRRRDVFVELIRAGVSPVMIHTDWGPLDTAATNCIGLEVEVVGPDERPRPAVLWHMGGVYFETGSAEPNEPGGTFWARVAAAQNVPGRTRYRIEAGADTTGGREANRQLSYRRGLWFAEKLMREGVAWEQITIDAQGEGRPRRPTPDDVVEPLNRYVWVDVRGGRRPISMESID